MEDKKIIIEGLNIPDAECILTPLEMQELVEKNIPQKCIFEEVGERTCPRCNKRTYYCASSLDENYAKQPDNYCSNCGQRFIQE